jgi:hypothetical protein
LLLALGPATFLFSAGTATRVVPSPQPQRLIGELAVLAD